MYKELHIFNVHNDEFGHTQTPIISSLPSTEPKFLILCLIAFWNWIANQTRDVAGLVYRSQDWDVG